MNTESIVKKGLEQFVQKHYRIRLLKGVFLSIALLGLAYLVVLALEYLFWLPSSIRFGLFWAYVAVALVLIFRFLVWPMMQLLGFKRNMSHLAAAELIGKHFSSVKDRLLNLLELEQAAKSAPEPSKSLMLASVKQRYINLDGIKFTEAIQFTDRSKYLFYSLPPIVVLLTLWLVNPAFVNDSSRRLINYSEHFQRPLSFDFEFDKTEYWVKEGESLALQIIASGTKIPARVYLQDGAKRILLESRDGFTYNATLENNFKSRNVSIQAGPFQSQNVKINVLELPKIQSLSAEVDYPAYTNFNNDVNKGKLNLKVPEGSQILWAIKTDANTQAQLMVNNQNTLKTTAKEDFSYQIFTKNSNSGLTDTLSYTVQVIKDQHPRITASLTEDSLLKNTFYLSGTVADDYGISRLEVIGENKTGEQIFNRSLAISSLKQQSFFTVLDEKIDSVALVYAKVYDNDQVNGAKFSISGKQNLAVLDQEALEERLKQDRFNQLDNLKKLQKQSDAINKNLTELKDALKGRKEIRFEDKQKAKDLTEQVKNLKDEIEKSKKDNEILNFEEQKNKTVDESVLEKQKKLEEMFEQMLDPELQKLLEELQQMMDEENKTEVEKALEEMEINNEDINKSLDQNMEWLKRLALDKQTEDLIKKLDDLAKEQEKLANKEEENTEEQKKVDDAFKALQEELKDIEKKAEELKAPSGFNDATAEQQEDVKKEQEKAKENLTGGEQKKANENQKKAGEKMQEMAEQMKEMKKSQEMEQQQEDMESLRAILENLIQLSFDQEKLLNQTKRIAANDPKINALTQEQKDLKDNFVIVEDSLNALAKRVIQIAGIVNKEVSSINTNMRKSQENLQELQLNPSTVYEQKSMTSLNNLALLLDEILKQMQQQMAQSKPGSSNCEKPGGSSSMPSLSELRKMQEKMGEEMQKGQKPGEKGGQGMGAKKLAQQAAQQAAIRKKIQEMAEELKDGKNGSGKKLNDIAEEMEKIEEDLVNKKPTPELLERQREILTRLLEAENADLERELDKERESKTAVTQQVLTQEQREKYLEKKRQELEILKSYPTGLKPYYKEKTDQFFEQ